MSRPNQAATKSFVERLLEVSARGPELGDPRTPGAISTWVGICDGIPDDMLKEIIPGTIRLLFRREDVAKRLSKCGLREGISLQHEAIAPYVIAFRRMRQIRRAGGNFDAQTMLAEARADIRDLNNRFHAALDEAVRLQEENQTLRVQLVSAKQGEAAAKSEAETYRKQAITARNELEDAAARALGKLSLALQSLKDALEMRLNDPNSVLIESASMSVQSYYMVLEDLGRGQDAMKLAKRILGDKMGAIGFA